MKYLPQFAQYDLFSKSPTLYIGGKLYYGTIFGLFSTVLALMSYLICGIYFLLEMFDTKNVNSFTSVQNPSTPQSIPFTSEKFYFGFGVQHPKTYEFFLDESIYNIKAYYKIATRNEEGFEWENSEVELEPCNISKFNTRYQKIFGKRKLNNMYCVKNFTYIIEGTYLQDKYSFLMFDFYRCQNSTENGNKCKPLDKIDFYLNSTFVAVEFTDISIDPSNYENPDSPILGETYSTVGNNFYREMHIFLKEVLFKSDRGLLFSNYKEKSYIQLDYLQDMFTLKAQDKFCSFTLKISNRIDVYERKYIKFQTTLANIGGIIKAVSTIGVILTTIYTQTSYELDLTNKMFSLSEVTSHKNQVLLNQNSNKKNIGDVNSTNSFVNNKNKSNNYVKNANTVSLKKLNTNLMKQFYSSVSELGNFGKSDKKKKKKLLIKRMKTIKLSGIELFFSKIFPQCFNKKITIKLLNKGASIIKENLDIITILRELFNNVKLKKMIFTKEQFFLFNIDHKPILSLDQEIEDKKRTSKYLAKNETLSYDKSTSTQGRSGTENEKDYQKKIIDDKIFFKYIDRSMKCLLYE